MAENEIKFFVKRIFTKDLSLESPETPQIFDNIKATPKIAFNLDTSIATLDDITYHARCVKSGLKTSILMVDLPKNSFNTKSKAFKNSQKFILKRLADLIKIEVDTNNLHIAQYLIEKNIPLCAHIGLLQQTIKSN